MAANYDNVVRLMYDVFTSDDVRRRFINDTKNCLDSYEIPEEYRKGMTDIESAGKILTDAIKKKLRHTDIPEGNW